jgi:hypothetical protein
VGFVTFNAGIAFEEEKSSVGLRSLMQVLWNEQSILYLMNPHASIIIFVLMITYVYGSIVESLFYTCIISFDRLKYCKIWWQNMILNKTCEALY